MLCPLHDSHPFSSPCAGLTRASFSPAAKKDRRVKPGDGEEYGAAFWLLESGMGFSVNVISL
jgi:hypothetical protein